MKRSDLIKALSESDATQLAVLMAARENAKRAALENSSKSNLDAMRTAERMLAEFRTAHGLDDDGSPPTFKNIPEVHRFLTAQGYKVGLSTLYLDKAKMKKRNGVFTLAVVERYARDKGLERLSGPAQDDGAGPSQPPAPEARRADADAALKEKRGRILDVQYAREVGGLFPAEVAEREFAARAQAFRLGLEGWASKVGGDVAGLFGADPAQAAEVVALVGGDKAKAEELVAWALARVPAFVALFVDELAKALGDYASGLWLTREMSDHMRAWEESRAMRQVKEFRELCRDLGADEGQAERLSASFMIWRKVGRI